MPLLAKLKVLTVLLTLAIITGACGSGSSKHTQQQDSLAVLITAGKIDEAHAMARDMAMRLDELTPDETVTVLLAYLQAHNKAGGKDREIMREYLDIYEIATGDNPKDMEAAFKRALEVNPNVDFKQAAEEFRAALSEAEAYVELDEANEPAPVATPDKEDVTEKAETPTKADNATEKTETKTPAAEPAEPTEPID